MAFLFRISLLQSRKSSLFSPCLPQVHFFSFGNQSIHAIRKRRIPKQNIKVLAIRSYCFLIWLHTFSFIVTVFKVLYLLASHGKNGGSDGIQQL